MTSVRDVAALALLTLCPVFDASAADRTTHVFTCQVGGKTASVTEAAGVLTYRYGTAAKDEITVVGDPKSGNVLQMTQRFAGIERQLRFRNGDISYVVYSSEGNGRVGAAATSGLIVMRGEKRLSDRSCRPYAELELPDGFHGVPDDTDAYSAM